MNLQNLMSNQGLWISFWFIIFFIIYLLFKFKKIKVKIYEGEITRICNCCAVINHELIPSFSNHKDLSFYDSEEEHQATSPFVPFFKSKKEYIEDVTEVKIHGKRIRTNFKINRKNIEEMRKGSKIKIIYIYFFGKKILFNN